MKVDAARVHEATEAIYSALNEFTIGCVNPKAKRAIEPEIAILRSMADGPLNGLVDSLADWVDILFSERKHQRYGGAATVKSHVLEDLSRIESCVGRPCEGGMMLMSDALAHLSSVIQGLSDDFLISQMSSIIGAFTLHAQAPMTTSDFSQYARATLEVLLAECERRGLTSHQTVGEAQDWVRRVGVAKEPRVQ